LAESKLGVHVTSLFAEERMARLGKGIVGVHGKLRVFFITEEDPLYVIRFFDTFFAEYPRDAFKICGIAVDRAFHEPMAKTLVRLRRFYGAWSTFRLGLRFLGARLHRRSIKSLAASSEVPFTGSSAVVTQRAVASIQTEQTVRARTALSIDVEDWVYEPVHAARQSMVSSPRERSDSTGPCPMTCVALAITANEQFWANTCIVGRHDRTT
jgi:hypothetical protein